jgi:tRNA U34 5-carboxymethylaminomethyl modifying GTPase MnmE/TrmE
MTYSKHNLADTIVALATPPGLGAIGIIRLSGTDAIRIVQKVFGGKDLTQQDSHSLHFQSAPLLHRGKRSRSFLPRLALHPAASVGIVY